MPALGPMPPAVLAELLGRLGFALAAGVDLRRAWAAETARVPTRWRSAMESVSRGLDAGDGLSQAMRGARDVFPEIVCAMVEVGDRTGRETEVLRDVADTLRQAVRSRRALVAGLVRPAVQLAMAVVAVGVLILASGNGASSPTADMLGLGLSGSRGLTIYAGAIAAIIATAFVLAPLAGRSWRRHGVVRRLGSCLPVLGPALAADEAAGWCRAASLASHAGLDAGRLVALASAAAPGLRIPAAAVEERLRAGDDLGTALARFGRLPDRAVEAVRVGELTGTLPATLERLASLLEEESRAGISAAVRGAGFLAWGAVALLATMVVYRFFSFYVGLIEQAGRPL